jgi:hypothetical protein
MKLLGILGDSGSAQSGRELSISAGAGFGIFLDLNRDEVVEMDFWGRRSVLQSIASP